MEGEIFGVAINWGINKQDRCIKAFMISRSERVIVIIIKLLHKWKWINKTRRDAGSDSKASERNS